MGCCGLQSLWTWRNFCYSRRIASIMLGGHKTHEMQLSRLNTLKHPKLVPSSGATELTVSATLKQKNSSIKGTEKP
ncbi:hypothetical protein LXL04_027719 [Taraxacum kok-saghyz]